MPINCSILHWKQRLSPPYVRRTTLPLLISPRRAVVFMGGGIAFFLLKKRGFARLQPDLA
jgi:hypothetical protein